MRLEAKKYVFDIQRAAALIAEFTSGLSLEEYQSRPMVRAAVEREFEIIGEALTQLMKVDTAVAVRISDHRRIVAFRNVLVHGYADVDDQLVWDVITTKLSTPQEEVSALLNPSLWTVVLRNNLAHSIVQVDPPSSVSTDLTGLFWRLFTVLH